MHKSNDMNSVTVIAWLQHCVLLFATETCWSGLSCWALLEGSSTLVMGEGVHISFISLLSGSTIDILLWNSLKSEKAKWKTWTTDRIMEISSYCWWGCFHMSRMNWRVLAGQTPSADEVHVIYFSRACGETDFPDLNKNICAFPILFLKRRLSQADLNLWNYCCEINGAHSARQLLWKMITNLNHLLINTIL